MSHTKPVFFIHLSRASSSPPVVSQRRLEQGPVLCTTPRTLMARYKINNSYSQLFAIMSRLCAHKGWKPRSVEIHGVGSGQLVRRSTKVSVAVWLWSEVELVSRVRLGRSHKGESGICPLQFSREPAEAASKHGHCSRWSSSASQLVAWNSPGRLAKARWKPGLASTLGGDAWWHH